jgi:TATA-box binding protein (TBP) (component of TFIID and TFIIIB)
MNETKILTKNIIDVEKLEIHNLPEGVKVATMCSSCFLGTKLNIDNIEKYLELSEDDILTIKRSTSSVRTLIDLKKSTKKPDPEKKEGGNNFYNSITLIVRVSEGKSENLNEEPKINIKLFKNGSIQMSGCKSVKAVNNALSKVLLKLAIIKGRLENGKIQEITFVEDLKNLIITKFKIDMIYCNYKISMQVDREKLCDLLKKKKVKCIYEPCIRACVIIKYVPTADNVDFKEVSIFIFKKGNIIITGARSRNQVIEAYNYINNIFIVHSYEIIKKSDEEEEDEIMGLYEEVLRDVERGLVEI